jgi:hypothetical protein
MKLYTAFDVSLRSVAICVVDELDEVRYETKVASDVDRIIACLRSFVSVTRTAEILNVGARSTA